MLRWRTQKQFAHSHHASGIGARLRAPVGARPTSRRASYTRTRCGRLYAQRKGMPVKRGREVDVGPNLGYTTTGPPVSSERALRAGAGLPSALRSRHPLVGAVLGSGQDFFRAPLYRFVADDALSAACAERSKASRPSAIGPSSSLVLWKTTDSSSDVPRPISQLSLRHPAKPLAARRPTLATRLPSSLSKTSSLFSRARVDSFFVISFPTIHIGSIRTTVVRHPRVVTRLPAR